jgi:uncharacterized protein involved in outer membrane biogenesis
LVCVATIALLLAFDGNWIRAPLERRLAAATGREVRIESLDLRWRSGLQFQLRGVSIGDRVAGEAQMLRARQIGAHVSPWALLRGRLELIELRLSGADVNVQRDAEGRVNWDRLDAAVDPAAAADPIPPLPIPIASLILDDVKVRYRDKSRNIDLRVRVDSLPLSSATAPWQTRIDAEGNYGKSALKGRVFTGPVLTLQDTDQPVPFKGSLKAGRTDVEAEGFVADLEGPMAIDARVRIAGPSLATLYPTLPLALPSTPPYRIEGRLRGRGQRYRMDEVAGRIGSSDIRGSASFDMTKPRPHLVADLLSDRVALEDLGVMAGIEPRAHSPRPDGRVLPNQRFDIPRMNAIDADVSIKARHVAVNPAVPLEDFSARARLVGGILRLEPLNFGFAGGAIVSTVVLDARQRPIRADTSVDFRKVDFARLFPTIDQSRLSAGELGAQIRLRGQGQSVAEVLASSNGTLAVAMDGGRVSHAVIAAASLDGGRLLPLLIRGDEPIAVRCAAIIVSVTEGIAHSQLMVIDTQAARIDGTGAIDLKSERFELELRPQPKEPSILSLRAPLFVRGGFQDARVEVGPGALLRGGAALALAAAHPFAALLPLIETGPGEDSNCSQLLAPVAPALKQAEESSKRPPNAHSGSVSRGKKS